MWMKSGREATEVIPQVLFSRAWYMLCHRHNGEMPLKGSGFFSNFIQRVYMRFNMNWNYSDFIQFCNFRACYFVQLIENENIPDSTPTYIYANLAVL